MRQVNQPLLIPHSIQSARGDFSLRGGVIRAAEAAKSILRPGADIGVAGVRRSLQSSQYQESKEVSLIQHIRVRPGRETAAVMQVAANRVDLIAEARAD